MSGEMISSDTFGNMESKFQWLPCILTIICICVGLLLILVIIFSINCREKTESEENQSSKVSNVSTECGCCSSPQSPQKSQKSKSPQKSQSPPRPQKSQSPESAPRKKPEKSVNTLTELNERILSGPAMVMFTAKWCGICQNVAPLFLEASLESDIPFYEMDEKGNAEILKRYKIQGFPTILKFKNNRSSKYSGNRSVKSILKFSQIG